MEYKTQDKYKIKEGMAVYIPDLYFLNRFQCYFVVNKILKNNKDYPIRICYGNAVIKDVKTSYIYHKKAKAMKRALKNKIESVKTNIDKLKVELQDLEKKL